LNRIYAFQIHNIVKSKSYDFYLIL